MKLVETSPIKLWQSKTELMSFTQKQYFQNTNNPRSPRSQTEWDPPANRCERKSIYLIVWELGCCPPSWSQTENREGTITYYILVLETRRGTGTGWKYKVRSSKFYRASCAQLNTANESPQLPKFCLFLSNLSLLCERYWSTQIDDISLIIHKKLALVTGAQLHSHPNNIPPCPQLQSHQLMYMQSQIMLIWEPFREG
jgi:hypothetical protein